MRPFTITGTTERSRLGIDGRGEMLFNVANSGSAPDRALARVVPLGNTRTEWMQIGGEAEREFQPNGTHQYSVALAVPPGTAPGTYTFRFDIASARKTGEEYVEGPTATFEVTAAAEPKSRRWIWIVVALAVLLVAGVVTWLLLRPRAAAPAAVTETIAPAAEPTMATVPDVVSERKFVTDGVVELQSAGFTVVLFARQDPSPRPGTIVDQSPEAETLQQKGTKIELTVAVRGPVDLTLDDADAAHLSAATAERLRRVLPAIRPSLPPPVINVAVPQLEGTDLVQALLALQQRGLQGVVKVMDAPGVRIDVVRGQRPSQGIPVSQGSDVQLFVGTRGSFTGRTHQELAALTPAHVQQLRRAVQTQSAMRQKVKENR